MGFTYQQVEQFRQDGFVIAENLFSPDEVALMLDNVHNGDRVKNTILETSDASNRKARLAIWDDLGDDLWSKVSTCPRIMNRARVLMGEEAAFFHGKVMLKTAKSGGAWEWHQDYGYWYGDGYVYPRMLSVFVALDEATIENGCLKVLRGSHKVGRINHGGVVSTNGAAGVQMTTDFERMKQMEKLFELVHCQMKPGSALFFDCNLLHSSGPNESERNRMSFIVCYNALSNPLIVDGEMKYDKPSPEGSDNLFG